MRTPRSANRWSGIGIFFVFVLLASVLYLFFPQNPKFRQSLVLSGDPTIVVSWGPQGSNTVIFVFPGTLEINATHGYGWYSLEALQRLDDIEGRRGALLVSSLSDSLAMPVQWYVTNKMKSGEKRSDIIGVVRSSVSFFSLLKSVFQKQTNLSLAHVYPVWKSIHGVDPRTDVIDFRNVDTVTPVVEPDGTTAYQFDPQKYDAVIGDVLEDFPIRQEAIRIAIYNTTERPGMGQQVGRVLDHVGAVVTFVGNTNEEQIRESCVIQITPDVRQSKTTRFIEEYLHCRVVNQGDIHGSIRLLLGDPFGKRYGPFEK